MFNILNLCFGLLFFALLLYATIVSLAENERRAATRSFLLAILLPLPYVLVVFVSFEHADTLSLILSVLTVALVLALLLPYGRRVTAEDDTPRVKIDERDTMFSRNALTQGSDQFDDYYSRNPDKKDLDDRFRARPGLLNRNAKHYDPISFSASYATFRTVEALSPTLNRQPRGSDPAKLDPTRMSRFIERWAKSLGAVSVGFTKLKDYHLYSVLGRGTRYGSPVELEHKYAVAVTVEMDKRMIDSAPYGPTVMESAQQYLSSGTIAVQISEFLRQLGYPARAHIDANYFVVCPLVARDAGLGEIGRMGLLMTPELGPRVRIAVVTTDMPLDTNAKARDYTMIDFCRRCKKCADICPSKAIPFGEKTEIDGVRRWQINSEGCFTYWCSVGTDCALCVRVCPYSHPDSLLHNLVRRGVRNSAVFREFALKMDDLFYGRKPPPHPLPDWMNVREI